MIFQKSSNQRISSHKDAEIEYPSSLPSVLCVTWIDAVTVGDSGWMEKDKAIAAAKESLPIMTTFGFLLYESPDQIALTSTIGPNETSYIDKIPKRMIIRIEEFKYGKV